MSSAADFAGSEGQPAVIGIDLGTTNSLVALVEQGVPVVLPDPTTGSTLVPSVVYFPESGAAPVVGEAAKAHLSAEPGRTVYSAKRLMGRGYADVAAEASSLPYRLSPESESVAAIDLSGGRVVTPPEVGAHVLRALTRTWGGR
jgi:molecular chaperone DnaK (HSP70)